jgi:hypothetical protein
MSSTPLSALSLGLGFPWSAVLPSVAAAVAASLLTWFAAQFTAAAQLQKTLLDASRLLVESSQKQHALDTARVLELEQTVRERESEVIRQRGELRSLQQWQRSARRFARRSGFEFPTGWQGEELDEG